MGFQNETARVLKLSGSESHPASYSVILLFSLEETNLSYRRNI
jgi:hypothetical protein